MPFDFDLYDEEEAVDEPHQQVPPPDYPYPTPQQAVSNVVQGLVDYSEEEIDDQLSDVEKRLEIAAHFRLLLRDHLFAEPVSEAGLIVENLVRTFIKKKLKVLLGIEEAAPKAKVSDTLTPNQIEALRLVADKVLSQQGRSSDDEQQVQEQKQPQIKKAPARSSTPEPALKSKPRAREQRPAPRRESSPPIPPSIAQPTTDMSDPDVIVKGGKRYRREISPETGKEYLKDISEPVKSARRIPQPASSAHYNQVAAIHAGETMRQIQANPILGTAFNKITITGGEE